MLVNTKEEENQLVKFDVLDKDGQSQRRNQRFNPFDDGNLIMIYRRLCIDDSRVGYSGMFRMQYSIFLFFVLHD